jgi:hypothetical protein
VRRGSTRRLCSATQDGPALDAREVTVMTTSTEADCTTERERQAQQEGA